MDGPDGLSLPSLTCGSVTFKRTGRSLHAYTYVHLIYDVVPTSILNTVTLNEDREIEGLLEVIELHYSV
jgi:hypothetical protein